MRASTVVSSVFGIGFFSFAQGTIMSAVALPLAVLITVRAGGMSVLGASLIVFVIGMFACADHMRETGRKDPPECVIDELAGQWLASAFASLSLGGLLPVATHLSLPAFGLSFVLFRLFDIWKPWPVSWAETYSGGLGVMLDDMVAGLMAGALVVAARYFFHI